MYTVCSSRYLHASTDASFSMQKRSHRCKKLNKSYHAANQHLCHQKCQKSVHVFATILKLSLIWCREEKGSEACVGQISQITISAVAAKVCTTEAGFTVRLRKEKICTYHWPLHKIRRNWHFKRLLEQRLGFYYGKHFQTLPWCQKLWEQLCGYRHQVNDFY